MRHTISVLVENKFGVLARVAGLFSGRGYNIDSLNVGETEDPTISRMTIVARGDDRILEQITKQLNKLIDVIKVTDLTSEEHVERELAMIKVSAPQKVRSEIIQLASIFRSSIVDVSLESLIISVTGDEDKINALIDMLRPYGIREISRSGRVAISRGR
ncbi:MAG: acetolactate synthase small subunit [Candidatus Poribacteria bacterium]|nr:acetolactate synthase small subunit [Candidatus Poribacteria bacterium]